MTISTEQAALQPIIPVLPSEKLQRTLRKALKHLSISKHLTEKQLEEMVAFIENETEETTHDAHGKDKTLRALRSYHKLIQVAADSKGFVQVLGAARDHVIENLQMWSKIEYDYAVKKLTDDMSLFSKEAEAQKSEQTLALTKFEAWIDDTVKHNNNNNSNEEDGLLREFFKTQAEPWSEEDETIKMISWFHVVYRAYGKQTPIQERVLCDLAHPNNTIERAYPEQETFKFMEKVLNDSKDFLDYLERLEVCCNADTHKAKELLRILAMKVWKSIRCLKLVAFTSDVLLEIMQLPLYAGEEQWVHKTNDQWPLGVHIRDSPIVESITIAIIVVIGLLAASVPILKILLTPDLLVMKRAVKVLNTLKKRFSALSESGR